MLSYVQQKILSKLIQNNALRYSELQPADIDRDLFNYHLRFLLTKKFILKQDEFYSLSEYGKKYSLNLDIKGNELELFKISVIVVLRKKTKSGLEILMQKRLRHPFYGDTLPGISGKVLPGEKIITTAKRKLKEETGLDGYLKFSGVIRKIRRGKAGKLIEDCLYHVCLGDEYQGSLIKSNDFGVNFWMNISEAPELMTNNFSFSKFDREFLKLIEDKPRKFFYKEIEEVIEAI